MSEIDISALRSEFPSLERLIYMNTGTSGPTPRPVVRRMCAVLEEQAELGPALPDSMKRTFDRLAATRAAAADWLGGHPEEIALTDNTSHGLSLIASGIDWRPGDEVIISRLEHISGLLPWYHAAERYGIRVVEAPLTSHTLTVDAVEKAITPRTRLICMSHVSYVTGARLPVEEVAAFARARGILLAVDGAQAAGAIPVDVKASRIPLYAFPGQKWLLGPEGTGGLYVAREVMERIEVSHIGWASVDVEETGPYDGYGLHPSARRFEVGTLNDAGFAGLNEAMSFVDRLGRQAVPARIASLTDRCKERLTAIPGVELFTPMPAEESAGLVSFRIEGISPKDAVDALFEEENILCRSVPEPELLRLSIHFFNTEEEVDAVTGAVERLTRQRPPARS